jgi:hypothetical protein
VSAYPERDKWVCRITVRGVTEEFMAATRMQAMWMAVEWARTVVRAAA